MMKENNTCFDLSIRLLALSSASVLIYSLHRRCSLFLSLVWRPLFTEHFVSLCSPALDHHCLSFFLFSISSRLSLLFVFFFFKHQVIVWFDCAWNCLYMCQMDGLIQLGVNTDCMCECLFLFVLCQNVMYYHTALSAVFDWICVSQVFIIIIKIKHIKSIFTISQSQQQQQRKPKSLTFPLSFKLSVLVL